LRKALVWFGAQKIRGTAAVNRVLTACGTAPFTSGTTAAQLLKRPQIRLDDLAGILAVPAEFTPDVRAQAEIEIKYAGFIERQRVEVEKFKNLEKIRIPDKIHYESIPGLSKEIQEKLRTMRPLSLGQACRISGVTPAALTVLMVWLRKYADTKE
jgi:tRNA uridine 5-carboxymethylaminomethyl modification enzyme